MASAALLLSTGRASAEEGPGYSLRFGVGAQGGPFIVPGVTTVGIVGLQLKMGVQFNNLVAVYLAANGDVVVGRWNGTAYAVALLVDFTFNDTIFVGVGPEAGELIATGHGLEVGGTLIGGRLHLAWCPGNPWDKTGTARGGVTVSVDVRLLSGAYDFILGNGFLPESRTYGGPFIFSPMLGVSYLAF